MKYKIENLAIGQKVAYINKRAPMYGRIIRMMPHVRGGCVVVRSWDSFADIVRVRDITSVINP